MANSRPDVSTMETTSREGGPRRRGNAHLRYYAILVGWASLTIAIFLWLLNSSVKSNREIFDSPWTLPSNVLESGPDSYSTAWSIANMGGYFANSVLVTTLAVIVTVAVSAPAAYVLSRIAFPGNRAVTYYFIAGMGVPFQLILIPLYVMFVQIGLVNTRLGLIVVYVGVSIPFTILLLTGFFRSLPTELEEAGAVDGASEFRIFFRIMMPVATPGLFTAAIFNFVIIWQEFLLAQLLISSEENRTLPVGLLSLRQALTFSSEWAALFAAVLIVVVPSFVVFVLLSNRIMSGLTLGAGK